MAYNQGDYDAASDFFERSLAQQKALDDRRNVAAILEEMGRLAGKKGDYRLMRRQCTESLALFRELGDKRGIANSLHLLGIASLQQADYVAARASFADESGDQEAQGISLFNLGFAARGEGDWERANLMYSRSLEMFRRLGNKRGIVGCFVGIALTLYLSTEGAGERLREEIGVPVPPSEQPYYELALTALHTRACYELP